LIACPAGDADSIGTMAERIGAETSPPDHRNCLVPAADEQKRQRQRW
jgi:hypothetical protein